ncbi:MAG TPA: serine/threonine-protein kinase [Polyangiaceae bacterium]|nr:serine/threonine-protein kinase [Polyangiaceae bacterium]
MALNSRRCPACGARYPADFRVCPRDATPLEDAPEGEDPLIGQVLDNTYEITRVLGEGGMGRVYEARHARLHKKRFAMKLLHGDLTRQPDVVTRFQREAEASSAIGHPNVVDVYDVNVTAEGQPYIVAELLQGEQFGDYLDRVGRLPVADAVRIVRQICQALGAAHAQGIVHRDVKPENVFLTGNIAQMSTAHVKVLDFGISKVQGGDGENLTKTGMVMGTPDYMAPEQAKGDKVDARADIYAVGAILYRALTGHKPFEGLDPMATLTAVIVHEPKRPSAIERSIPLTLELVIQRAMAKRLNDRYASMEELEQELAPFDTSVVVSATSETEPAPADIPAGSVDRAAKTLFNRVSPRTLGEALEETTRNVQLARPGILLFTALGLFWLLVNVSVASGAAIRLARGTASDLTGAEAVMALVGVMAGLATPIWLWVRHLKNDVWPSTPRSVQWMWRLRTAVLYSSAAYGITALFVQLFEVIVAQHSLGVARPGWALLTFLISMGVAGFTWFLTRPVERPDP